MHLSEHLSRSPNPFNLLLDTRFFNRVYLYEACALNWPTRDILFAEFQVREEYTADVDFLDVSGT